jgi:membrane AbrB-like protein
MYFWITIGIGLLGGYMGLKYKMPAGMMVGSIMTVAIFNIATGSAYFPGWVKLFSSSLAGAYIGAKVTKRDILLLRLIIKPSIIMVISMMSYNILCGFFLSHFSGLDLATALLATAPGGITEISLVAIDMGGNPATVSVIQLLRLFVVLCCTPLMLKAFIRRIGAKRQETVAKGRDDGTSTADTSALSGKVAEDQEETLDKRREYKNLLITMLVALSCGIVGYLSKLPAGTLVFALIGVATLNLTTQKSYMPLFMRRAAQALNGSLIGSRFQLVDLILVKNSLVFIGISISGWLVLNILLGIILSKSGKISIETAVLATAAGGSSDMGLLAEEMGANQTQVVALQLVRVISVLCLYPPVIKAVTGLL